MSRLQDTLTVPASLPDDVADATLVGRAWLPDIGMPTTVSVRRGRVLDISTVAPTMTDVLAAPAPIDLVSEGRDIGDIASVLANSAHDRRSPDSPWLLAPCDIQPVKASGVTFAASLLERVIEEQAGGDPARADSIRAQITAVIGSDLSAIVPGSPEAMALKEQLVADGMWSQYLEVGIGPDPEIFTKAPPLASVGTGSEIGILSTSVWNNPEPEVALAVAPSGQIVGATLANDVNLRDIEGRSALLLGKAKDNNASSAVGPLIRLFDPSFGLDDVRAASLTMTVAGDDGYVLEGSSSLTHISRDITDLVAATVGAHHQYPDGFFLLTGTMFAPTEDRDEPGGGFTHHVGDVVSISSPRLGTLVNRVVHSETAEPWSYGLRRFMDDLADRGLLGTDR